MSDEAREAAFYQEHKDDPAVWGAPAEAPDEQRRARLGVTITVRFPADEADAIREMAENTGGTYSAIVRQAVAAFLRPPVTIERGQQDAISGQLPGVGEPGAAVRDPAPSPAVPTTTTGRLPRTIVTTG